MKKSCLAILLCVGLLAACAHQGGDPSLSRSGVEVYGVIDAGVGSSRQSN
ncbi:hypothetical protein [Alcaligenes endophyticus]|uniref:Lipoprotein n=1 Tax=Alcaligenes endophyticus TaxID=1929088 RepID=A0ABT8EKV7_9BURK|nr:hypothetical protein [Alcaligenes endophyticus]MCX5590715.1 hypothetical protein [Alcaligenes endophyticus]MDN4121921.1 hypothetical protein [Alcaligenes endophyticus]